MVLLHVLLLSAFSSTATSQEKLQGTIFIETRILHFDPLDGMKSTQKISLYADAATKKVRLHHEYKTGDSWGVPSIGDEFKILNVATNYENKSLEFSVSGTTKTGLSAIVLGALPAIDYKLNFKFDGANQKNKWVISGCHDGYPAYKVWVDNAITNFITDLYEYRHKSIRLHKLFGDCDIQVNVNKVLDD